MLYFAYGSNMSTARLRQRVPSAVPLGCHILGEHDLRFHKVSRDGSGKCDAFSTSDHRDEVYGALFGIDEDEKVSLDRAEGLGFDYEEKMVKVIASDGVIRSAVTYIAIRIDETIRPYTWYLNHVLVGATETGLPEAYIQEKIMAVESTEDSNRERDASQRAIHS